MLKFNEKSYLQFFFFAFLLLLIAGCFFSCIKKKEYRYTTIETTPSSAKVLINNEFVGETPLFYSYLLEDPKVNISFIKDNYHIFTKNNYSFQAINSFDLVPLTIPVEIELSHLADYIYLNQSLVGRNEKKLLLDLNLKKYQLAIFKKGFHPLVEEITITKDTKNIALNLKKINSSRSFTLTSALDEVEVYYNNLMIGHLPYQEKIIVGEPYQFTFKKKGYQTKNLVFSFTSFRPKNINVSLIPLVLENYQIKLIGFPARTTTMFFKGTTLVAKTQNEQVNLIKGKYHMVVENPQYFTYRQEIEVEQNKTIPISLIPQVAKGVKFLAKKKYSSKRNIVFSGLDYNQDYFFINDFSKSIKIVLDNNLNPVEQIFYRDFTSLENSLLSKKIFFPLASFKDFVFWEGTFYHSSELSLNNSAEIIFSDWLANKMLLVNQGKEILIYQLSGNQRLSLLATVDFHNLKSFKKNALTNLALGQAFFLSPETILFIEKNNQEALLYHLPSQKITAFVKDFQNKPVVIEGMFVYQYLVFLIIENNQVAIFDQQGNFFTKITLPDKTEEIFALVIKNNMLYLFQKKNIIIYKFL